MRGRPAKRLLYLCFLILLTAAPAAAQATRPAEFHIPFDFAVQGRRLPAGTYTVGRLNQSNPDTLMMKNSAGRVRTFFTQRVEAEDYKEVALLVFNRYGDEYILAEVWAAGERSGRQLPGRFSKDKGSGGPVAVSVKGALTKSR